LILQNLEELENDLRRNGLRPVYLILGPEQYQCNRALNLLRSKAVAPDSGAFDYSEFTGGDTSIDEIVESANTFPMLSERRVVLVRDVEKLKDPEQEALIDCLRSLSPRSMIILSAAELDHRKKFFKTLREKSCVAELPKLKGVALERWAEAFINRQGYRISPAAIRKILDLAGSDLQTLASELEKLFLYAGSEKSVSDEAIENLIRSSRQHGIFELIGAVGQRNRSKALQSLANLLGTGEHPLVIVAMMARHCRQILIAKELLLQGMKASEIARAAQIPAFILDQFLRQVRAADSFEVQEMYLRLADVDRKLKSSSGDGRLLLEGLICALV
jgi:DNA polymerase-3 subunit delta